MANLGLVITPTARPPGRWEWERERESERKREKGLAPGTLSHQQPATPEHGRFKRGRKYTCRKHSQLKVETEWRRGSCPRITVPHERETLCAVGDSDEINKKEITLKTEVLKDNILNVCGSMGSASSEQKYIKQHLSQIISTSCFIVDLYAHLIWVWPFV